MIELAIAALFCAVGVRSVMRWMGKTFIEKFEQNSSMKDNGGSAHAFVPMASNTNATRPMGISVYPNLR